MCLSVSAPCLRLSVLLSLFLLLSSFFPYFSVIVPLSLCFCLSVPVNVSVLVALIQPLSNFLCLSASVYLSLYLSLFMCVMSVSLSLPICFSASLYLSLGVCLCHSATISLSLPQFVLLWLYLRICASIPGCGPTFDRIIRTKLLSDTHGATSCCERGHPAPHSRGSSLSCVPEMGCSPCLRRHIMERHRLEVKWTRTRLASCIWFTIPRQATNQLFSQSGPDLDPACNDGQHICTLIYLW